MSEDLSLQELISLLDEAPEKESIVLSKDSKISDYVNEINLVKGIDKVSTTVLWYSYKKVWGGYLSKVEFFRQLKKEGFAQFRTGKKRGYLVDASSFDMSREGLLEAEYFAKENK